MDFSDWLFSEEYPLVVLITPNNTLEENVGSRYSVEVNYRTTLDETIEGAAKIILGYVSAAMKQQNFHVKHVYEQNPIRVLVSSRNWDDGEWVGLVSFNSEQNCFIISKGFYNRDRKTVSIQSSKKCNAKNAAEIVRELRNYMHSLKSEPDRRQEKLKPVPLKRGPK